MNESLAPSDMEKLAQVMSSCISRGNREETDGCVKVLAEERLKMHGKRLKLRPQNNFREVQYDLGFLNTDVPLDELAEALEESHHGTTLCLYGPPGTGKTAFAHYIANFLDRALLAKRASDLLSPWLGATEQNIAAMFEEASAEAVLLLDEADSFLHDRKTARNRWEVTQVNEMLVQMEDFNGLFICSTNLMDDVDSASLRRFTFKVFFDYMTREQRRAMFCSTLQSLGIIPSQGPSEQGLLRRLDALHNLTPGDFALFLRQRMIIKRHVHPEELLQTLEREAEAKGIARIGKIGFR